MAPTHPLLRWFFRMTLVCVFLFTFSIAAVTGQSIPAVTGLSRPLPDLSILLVSARCSAPCFLGLTPGQVALVAGLDQLRAHPLVQSVAPVAPNLVYPAPSNLYDVAFVQTLAPLQSVRVQFLTEARTNLVEGILLLNSDLQWSDILLTFGQPVDFVLDEGFHPSLVTQVAFYPQYQMYVQDVVAVDATSEASGGNLQASLLIGFVSPEQYAQQRSYYPADAFQRGD